MSKLGSPRGVGLAAAVLLVASLAGCTKGIGGKCSHDTACDFGLACVFSDVVVVDCCTVTSGGQLTCDPTDFGVINRGIAPDCEYDANGQLKPRLRRLTCLGATFEEYKLWTGALELDGMGNPTNNPELIAIGLDKSLTNDCTCESGANFEPGDPSMPYDPVLAAPPELALCPRDPGPPEPDDSIEPPTVAPMDCPQPPDGDTCPPCVAFPVP